MAYLNLDYIPFFISHLELNIPKHTFTLHEWCVAMKGDYDALIKNNT